MNLKRNLICCITGVFSFLIANAQTSKIFVDFGLNDKTNGLLTASPDVNGNYWNNVISTTSGTIVSIIDNKNVATGATLTLGSGFSSNGIVTGGLLNPSPGLLGDLAINTATHDYFYATNGTIKLTGLGQQKKYVFHMFGSRQINTETRVTQYSITGANSSTFNLTTTGAGIGNGGYDGNNNVIAKSDTLYADADGTINISVAKQAGIYAYINCMKIEVFENNDGKVYNLINKGFESGSLDSWTKDAKSVNSVALVNKDQAHQGVYALKLGGDNVSVSQQISFVGGLKEYILSGYFYKPAALVTGQAAYLTLSYYDKDKQLLLSSKSDSITSASPSGLFIKLQTNLRIPAGTSYITSKVTWVNANNSAGGVYFDDLSLDQPLLDNLKITYMGSSVPYGQGATNLQGYTYLYTQLLNARKSTGGKDWSTVNISIGGNNTTAVLNRYTRDLTPQKSKYVIFALSLGNEGIHEQGQTAFNSFKTNMQTLITKARADGMIPVLTNCYTRNDFTLKDYDFVKQMNMWIHTLDVPSINLLGGVDNGAGKWAPAYWHDPGHPDDEGHQELAYTIVPSLFDALSNGKPQPTDIDAANEGTQISKPILFKPDNITHPFTITITIKANGKGSIIHLKDTLNKPGAISITDKGSVEYRSPLYQKITSTASVTDGKWHTITLTHYYA
ncbi:MAG: SGNH/GDSL hydrolase family protein, partial [Sphingobacteriaceae bacterium]